jgi:2-keto-4-pentenoate hydratase/2-oxohepta-3-ene-1,7-dioic acid hydratase in catechol pathway
MKLIRFRDAQGQIHQGVLEADGQARVITGDILAEDFTFTPQRLRPAKLLAPVAPVALFCIGLNYRKHAAETSAGIPEFPVLFMKNIACVQNPGDPVELPRHLSSGQVDYECELAIVIGRKAKNVSSARALDYVLGFTAANDVSARDWQRQWGGSQWCRGKTFDTFCPLGPVIVTPDEISDPNNLMIQTRVNGRTLQHSNTSDMIFSVERIIEFLSGSTTLLPGTVILTGTPEGVGMARQPPVWLKPGDQVEVEIDKIGTLANPVIAEPV